MTTKPFAAASIATLLALSQANGIAADGATAPYNEAVTIVNGKRVVDVRTIPSYSRGLERSFTKPGDPLSTTYKAIETENGLMDCSVPFYYPTACIPSDYGKVVRDRTWTVKIKGAWYSCIGRAKPIKCIPLNGDGKLRVLPSMNE